MFEICCVPKYDDHPLSQTIQNIWKMLLYECVFPLFLLLTHIFMHIYRIHLTYNSFPCIYSTLSTTVKHTHTSDVRIHACHFATFLHISSCTLPTTDKKTMTLTRGKSPVYSYIWITNIPVNTVKYTTKHYKTEATPSRENISGEFITFLFPQLLHLDTGIEYAS